METKGNMVTLPTQGADNAVDSTQTVEESTKESLSVKVVSNSGDNPHKRLWDSDCEESTIKKRECLHSSASDVSVPSKCAQASVESVTRNGTGNSTEISNGENDNTAVETLGKTTTTTTTTQITPIERSVDLSVPQLPPWERYFTKRIVGDICLLIHSNRIAVVTLLPTHPILTPGRIVTSVDFAKRADNAVRGKGKRGAQALKVDSALCEVLCSDNSKYTVRAGIGGKLIEVNARLMKSPQLLAKRPQAEGYIAIMLPYDTRSKRKDKASDDVLMETETE